MRACSSAARSATVAVRAGGGRHIPASKESVTRDDTPPRSSSRLSPVSRSRRARHHGRRRSGQARRIGRRLPGEHAGARRAARRAAVRLAEGARQGGRPAVGRGHGQLRGGAQRARRGPGLRSGRAARQRRDRLGLDLQGRRLAGGRRPRQSGRHGPLHRPALGRQRPQPHRAPVRAAGSVRGGGRRPRARPSAARRPRRRRAERADLPRRARGPAGAAERCGRARLPDRVRRRPHGDDDGPVRRQLGGRRARMEGARARHRAPFRVGPPGRRDVLPRGSRQHRPVSRQLRDRGGRRAGRDDRRTATR